jgi:hypothetical protein
MISPEGITHLKAQRAILAMELQLVHDAQFQAGYRAYRDGTDDDIEIRKELSTKAARLAREIRVIEETLLKG